MGGLAGAGERRGFAGPGGPGGAGRVRLAGTSWLAVTVQNIDQLVLMRTYTQMLL